MWSNTLKPGPGLSVWQHYPACMLCDPHSSLGLNLCCDSSLVSLQLQDIVDHSVHRPPPRVRQLLPADCHWLNAADIHLPCVHACFDVFDGCIWPQPSSTAVQNATPGHQSIPQPSLVVRSHDKAFLYLDDLIWAWCQCHWHMAYLATAWQTQQHMARPDVLGLGTVPNAHSWPSLQSQRIGAQEGTPQPPTTTPTTGLQAPATTGPGCSAVEPRC